MTVKDKLNFLIKNGVKINALAMRVNCTPTTLGRWIHNEINISPRLEKDINIMIQNFIIELEQIKE